MRTKSTVHPIFTLDHHEDRSVYFLENVNQRLKLLSEDELEFIRACIFGKTLPGYKPYLFEIISNSVCGIDVDRMDYINRDANRCGFPSFQSDYIIHNIVIEPEGFHLAFKSKAKRDVHDFFDARRRMYENVYFHHTTQKVERVYTCMMRSLGLEMFKYGESTDDYNIETLLRTSEVTKERMRELDNRMLGHCCEGCIDVPIDKSLSGIDWFSMVIFV